MSDQQKKLVTLKNSLAKLLTQDAVDFDKVLELSSEIAQLDENNVRFTVDAGLINRLGKELVAKAATAVSELVKNGYDADAKKVDLVFENYEEEGGRLTISDDGVGMTKDDLIEGFMRISSTEKVRTPVSERYGRNRAGKKGIGRFATQRLGEKLTIITQTLESKEAIKVEINWNAFKGDHNLFSVKHKISTVPKEKPEGTILIIDKLRDAWSESAFKKAYRYVTDLVQPFPLSKIPLAKGKKQQDPGFKASIFKSVGKELTPVADQDKMINDYALATIEGHINKSGIGKCTIRSQQLKINEPYEIRNEVEIVEKNGKKIKKEIPFKGADQVRFKCLYFHRSYLPKQEAASINALLNHKGGIQLYRNGFRVPTIGEFQDDWLGFDISVRRRVILDPHGNNSFLGFVAVTDIEGKLFDETSNRENLSENDAFNDLKDFVFKSVIKAVGRISEARGTKGKAARKNYKTPVEKLEDSIGTISNIADEFEKKGEESTASAIRSVIADMKSAIVLQKGVEEDTINEISMLRVLSSLGITIGEFTHEVKNYLRALKDDSDFFVDTFPKGEEGKTARRLRENLSTFSSYTSYFDETVSQNTDRTIHPLPLDAELNKFSELIKPALVRANIKISISEEIESGLYTCPMHPSEFRSILFNFFTNSRKAILKADGEGMIEIDAGKEGSTLFFEFSDTGIGVPDEIKDRIFDPFFTTSSPVGHLESEQRELTGSGLGLKIVQDIVNSYGGKVFLSDPPKNFNTCFRVEIPLSTKKQLEDYGIDY